MGCWVSIVIFINLCDSFGLRVFLRVVLFHVEQFYRVFFFNLSGSTSEAEPKTRLICG